MSDSIKKWHEMQEEKAPFTLSNTNEHIGKIMHSNLDEMKKQSKKTTKEAYKILAYHNIEAIELALDIAKENELS